MQDRSFGREPGHTYEDDQSPQTQESQRRPAALLPEPTLDEFAFGVGCMRSDRMAPSEPPPNHPRAELLHFREPVMLLLDLTFHFIESCLAMTSRTSSYS